MKPPCQECPHASVPSSKERFKCFPNPFSPDLGEEQVINYYLDGPADIRITIYNIVSEIIKEYSYTSTSLEGEGRYNHYEVKWDGKNYASEIVSPGVYIIFISINYINGRSENITLKTVVLR